MAYDDIIDAAEEAITLDDLDRGVIEAIGRAIGVGSSLLFAFEETGRIRGIGGELSSRLDRYVEELYDLDPLQKILASIPPNPPTVPTSEVVNERQFLNSGAYSEFYKPNDIRHLIGLWIGDRPYGAPGMVGLLLCRGPLDHPFGDHDADLLRRIHPILHGVYRRDLLQRARHRQVDRLMSLLAASVNPRILILSDTLELLFVSDEAARCLARCSGFHDRLPPSILKRAADLVTRAGLRLRVATSRLEVPETTDLTATFDCHRLEDGRSVVLVTIEDRRAAAEGLSRLVSARRLTKAEGRVLELVAEGLSNQAIASTLFVSLDTVKTHVRHIFAKLEVTSRTQAAILAKMSMKRG